MEMLSNVQYVKDCNQMGIIKKKFLLLNLAIGSSSRRRLCVTQQCNTTRSNSFLQILLSVFLKYSENLFFEWLPI